MNAMLSLTASQLPCSELNSRFQSKLAVGIALIKTGLLHTELKEVVVGWLVQLLMFTEFF
jgi:hypothetical protein